MLPVHETEHPWLDWLEVTYDNTSSSLRRMKTPQAVTHINQLTRCQR